MGIKHNHTVARRPSDRRPFPPGGGIIAAGRGGDRRCHGLVVWTPGGAGTVIVLISLAGMLLSGSSAFVSCGVGTTALVAVAVIAR